MFEENIKTTQYIFNKKHFNLKKVKSELIKEDKKMN